MTETAVLKSTASEIVNKMFLSGIFHPEFGENMLATSVCEPNLCRGVPWTSGEKANAPM